MILNIIHLMRQAWVYIFYMATIYFFTYCIAFFLRKSYAYSRFPVIVRNRIHLYTMYKMKYKITDMDFSGHGGNAAAHEPLCTL